MSTFVPGLGHTIAGVEGWILRAGPDEQGRRLIGRDTRNVQLHIWCI